ncbi:carbon catabolite repressor protein 4 homolog 6 [Tanacetum coccineum]
MRCYRLDVCEDILCDELITSDLVSLGSDVVKEDGSLDPCFFDGVLDNLPTNVTIENNVSDKISENKFYDHNNGSHKAGGYEDGHEKERYGKQARADGVSSCSRDRKGLIAETRQKKRERTKIAMRNREVSSVVHAGKGVSSFALVEVTHMQAITEDSIGPQPTDNATQSSRKVDNKEIQHEAGSISSIMDDTVVMTSADKLLEAIYDLTIGEDSTSFLSELHGPDVANLVDGNGTSEVKILVGTPEVLNGSSITDSEPYIERHFYDPLGWTPMEIDAATGSSENKDMEWSVFMIETVYEITFMNTIERKGLITRFTQFITQTAEAEFQEVRLLTSYLGAGCKCEGYDLHVVGHSLGGAIAAMLGLKGGQKIHASLQKRRSSVLKEILE